MMDLKSILCPASSLLAAAAARHGPRRLLVPDMPRPTETAATRGHKTTSRTKTALKIPPHDSFLPSALSVPHTNIHAATATNINTSATIGGATAKASVIVSGPDTIIYNPPASEASPAHTPFLFLPRNDPRRSAIVRMRRATGLTDTASSSSSSTPSTSATSSAEAATTTTMATSSRAHLPPELKYPRRADQPRYHLTAEHVEEMRELRAQDPLTWSVAALARRFDCSPIFVSIAAPASRTHKEFLESQMERRRARWGPKRLAAKEERRKRAEMMYRGEL